MTTTSSSDSDVASTDGLWIERIGARQYTAHNGRGARVEIGSIEHDGRFTPGELLKLALAGCTGLTSDAILARRLGDGYAATVRVAGPKDPDDDRYPELHERLEVDLTGLDESMRTRLITAVERALDSSCTVARTLTRGAQVHLQVGDVGSDTPVSPADDEAH
ncbi:MAG: OsmC family protein [Cellulomonadaceae bacterium]